jgi:hypothetical protein
LFQIDDGTAFGGNFVGTASLVSNPNAPTWFHVAAVVRRSGGTGTVTLYVNGVVDPFTISTTVKLGSVTNGSALLIGQRNAVFGQTDGFSGDIDEVELINRDLAQLEIAAIHNAGSAGKCKCAVPQAGMTAWWPLDETAPNSSAEIIGGVKGTWTGSPTPVLGSEVLNSLHFTTAGDFVTVPSGAGELDFDTGSFTVDAWVRTTDPSAADRTIVGKRGGTTSNPQGYLLGLHTGLLLCQVGDGTAFVGNFLGTASLVSNPNAPTWFHVACVVSRPAGGPGTVTLYVNGVVDPLSISTTVPLGSVTNTSPLLIGQRNAAFLQTDAFSGDIDEVELFNRDLPKSEISAIYKAASDGKCKTIGSLQSGIPTVSEWGMIVLVTLLLLTGGFLIRRRRSRAPIA